MLPDHMCIDYSVCNSGCGKGYYKKRFNKGNKVFCAKCPIGSYSDRKNVEACTNCPQGKTTSYEGSTSHLNCHIG